jgi:ArsR family transcriptional regulator
VIEAEVLTAAGLLRARKIRQWTFCRRDEQRITEVRQMFNEGW